MYFHSAKSSGSSKMNGVSTSRPLSLRYVSTVWPAALNVLLSATTMAFLPGNSFLNMSGTFFIHPTPNSNAFVSLALSRASSMAIILYKFFQIISLLFQFV